MQHCCMQVMGTHRGRTSVTMQCWSQQAWTKGRRTADKKAGNDTTRGIPQEAAALHHCPDAVHAGQLSAHHRVLHRAVRRPTAFAH